MRLVADALPNGEEPFLSPGITLRFVLNLRGSRVLDVAAAHGQAIAWHGTGALAQNKHGGRRSMHPDTGLTADCHGYTHARLVQQLVQGQASWMCPNNFALQ